MRVLQGTKVAEAPPSWRDDISSRAVVIDLGAGDGRYVYESARRDPERMFVAVDPDADGLSEYAYRAARKPSRGGLENAAFVVAAAEALPAELLGLATLVRVNFPWGSLMRGLLEPDPAVLRALASLGAFGARWEVVMSYHPDHDPGAFNGDPLPPLDLAYLEETLVPGYTVAGLLVEEHRRLSADEALEIPSTWGRRLLHARPRDVYWLAGRISDVG